MEYGKAGGGTFFADGICMGPGQYFLLGTWQIPDLVYQCFLKYGVYLYGSVDMSDHDLPQGGCAY